MMFTPNTQVIETAGVGVGIGMATTPVTARLAETFSSIAMSSAEGSPEGGSTSMTATRSNRDQTSEPSSLWTNAGRRAMLDLKRQYQRDSDGKEGAQEGTSRSIDTMDHDAAAASTSAEPERDPFLETPRPSGRDCVATEDQEQEEQEDDFDYDRDIILDDADLEQDFENTADTASISEGHDSLAEPSYESEELEKERRKKAAIIRANRSFELNMKAARQEAEAEVKAKMAAAEAADALVAQELLEASVEIEQEEEEVEESEDKILRRQLEAEMEEDLETFEESSFQELADSTHHLSSTADLLNELVQERNGRQLTTPEELECQSWMYEVGRVGKPQRVGVWARA
ncbi:hypothetical protein BGW39_000118 [Mortierella sp. 14UC]|nr:hypothetical protein BGW39_000118 [Mortierella sp. 14UC]